MTVTARLEGLQRKHQALEAKIEDELHHPDFNERRLAELKKEKLKIKDEMRQLGTA